MKKQGLLAGIAVLVFTVAGCGKNMEDVPQIVVLSEEHSEEYHGKENADPDAEQIAAFCGDIYQKAVEDGTLENLEVIKDIVKIMGENGYVAVDERNQVDMTKPERVMHFYEAVNAKETANLTIIVVIYSGGFIKYDFHTVNGEVDIVRGYYQYGNGYLENLSTVSYTADSWQYTEEGYLLFGGSYYSEDFYVLLSGEVAEHMALRVEPLDERCRELNRQYLLPVGYRENKMFLVDWNEEDFGELDFYDLFDKLYPGIYKQPVPYRADENLGVGAVYRIPSYIFENVIGKYIGIDREQLRQRTIYLPEEEAYEYRPRGFYEMDYSDIPYPEVESYRENSDGTITLIVNAVYPKENTSRAYTHETVVRPFEDGGFQYVSNQILFPDEGYDTWWHCERLSVEEWGELYGKDTDVGDIEAEDEKVNDEEMQEGISSLYPSRETDCLLNEAEKKELESMALMAATQAKEVYRDTETGTDSFYAGTGREFYRERRNRVVALLGEAGYVSVTDGANMENYSEVRDFYAACQEEQDAMVTIFDVNWDGAIGVYTFIHRNGRLQTYYVQIGYQKDGGPKIQTTAVSDIAGMKLTEKGYFIYAYEVQVYHSSLRQYWRISPLSDQCREMTEKYISGLSYVNYNVLVTDWDSSNAEDILMPCMFEDIYRIHTGENLKPENGEISAKLYERIMTTYFPVTKEQVRKACGYRASTDGYPYEMILSHAYPPFGEVVNYTENPDGTLTLFVDGVWPDYDCDYAFTNIITLQTFEDGTFRYLSNSIEKKEMDIPLSGIRK